jgi:hypothetical protein
LDVFRKLWLSNLWGEGDVKSVDGKALSSQNLALDGKAKLDCSAFNPITLGEKRCKLYGSRFLTSRTSNANTAAPMGDKEELSIRTLAFAGRDLELSKKIAVARAVSVTEEEMIFTGNYPNSDEVLYEKKDLVKAVKDLRELHPDNDVPAPTEENKKSLAKALCALRQSLFKKNPQEKARLTAEAEKSVKSYEEFDKSIMQQELKHKFFDITTYLSIDQKTKYSAQYLGFEVQLSN